MSNENVYLNILLSKISNKETIIKCVKCESRHLRIIECQTRGGDEATTMFIKCLECKYMEVTND